MVLKVETGQKAPGFDIFDEKENRVTLSGQLGKWVVLYFYPKDLTPGCTVEAIDFSGKKEVFETAGAVIFGVSPDSVERHQRFRDKKDLSISLLSDPDKRVIESYGVWQQKKMAGHEYMGVVRSTLLIDPEGTIREIWEKIRVKGHVDKVLARLMELQKS